MRTACRRPDLVTLSVIRYAVFLLLALAGCHPAPTSQADCGIAPPGFSTWKGYAPLAMPIVPPLVNTIHLGKAGETTWNGARLDGTIDMSAAQILDTYLAAVAELNPRPLTTVTFDKGTSCARIARVRNLMERHLHCSTDTGCFQGVIPR